MRGAQVQRVLDQIYGVDLNPFAVAIARFRILLTALKAAGETRLVDAAGFQDQRGRGRFANPWPGGRKQIEATEAASRNPSLASLLPSRR